jgi:hypothetical protein
MEKQQTFERRRPGAAVAMLAVLGLMAGAACGGSDGPRAEEPAPAADDSSEQVAMIPENRFIEIQHVFDRRRPFVSRCFSTAIDEGELTDDDRGYVTIGLVITEQGRASNVRVLESNLDSGVLHNCVLGQVRNWEFGSLPRPLEYSYSYQFETL